MTWKLKKLEPEQPGVYKAVAPKPEDGYWMGYYVQLVFPGEQPEIGQSVYKNEYILSTPGWVTPDTFPFPDCFGEDCQGDLV